MSAEKPNSLCHFFAPLLNSFRYLLFVCLSLMHPSPSPLLQLTPFWTLQADCFLIDGELEVAVVMVTWKNRALGKPRCWKRRLGEGGKGHPLKKNEGSTHARLGWSLQTPPPPLCYQNADHPCKLLRLFSLFISLLGWKRGSSGMVKNAPRIGPSPYFWHSIAT